MEINIERSPQHWCPREGSNSELFAHENDTLTTRPQLQICNGSETANRGVIGNSSSDLPADKLFRKLNCKNHYFLEQLDLPGENI